MSLEPTSVNDESPPAEPKRVPGLGPILGLFLLAVLSTIIASTIAIVGYALASGTPFDSPDLISALPALLLSVVANCITLGLLASLRLGEPVNRRTKQWPPLMSVVGATLGTVALAQTLGTVVHWVGLGDYGSLAHIRDALSGSGPLALIGAALIVGLGPGIAEEFFFRGQLLPLLERILSRRGAWLLSSLGFGLIHMDPLHSSLAFVIGLYLGVVVLATGSIWPAVVAHSVNNIVATFTHDIGAMPVWAVALALLLAALVLARLKVAHGSLLGLAPSRLVDHSHETHAPH